jgi:hypothetical protein
MAVSGLEVERVFSGAADRHGRERPGLDLAQATEAPELGRMSASSRIDPGLSIERASRKPSSPTSPSWIARDRQVGELPTS